MGFAAAGLARGAMQGFGMISEALARIQGRKMEEAELRQRAAERQDERDFRDAQAAFNNEYRRREFERVGEVQARAERQHREERVAAAFERADALAAEGFAPSVAGPGALGDVSGISVGDPAKPGPLVSGLQQFDVSTVPTVQRGAWDPEQDVGLQRTLAEGRANVAAGFTPTGAARPLGTAGAPRPPTARQQTVQMLYTSGRQGYDTLENVLADPEFQTPGWFEQQSSRLPFGVGNVAATPRMRQMTQAAGQLSDSWLRLTSGAAVPEQEVERYARTFTPLAGDDEQTLAQKRAARASIVRAMELAAGMPGLDVASGLQESGVDLTDPDAVAEWLDAQTTGGTAVAPGLVAPAPTTPRLGIGERFRTRYGG